MDEIMVNEPVSISIFIDGATDPIATYKPPARFALDTTRYADGEHVMVIQAVNSVGNVGVRRIPFVVANGPGITVTGLRPGSRVRGTIELDVNAFGGNEPFNPERAESWGPIPVWTWVLCAVILAWAAWYGIEYFTTPKAFAQTPTYAPNPALAAANEPATQAEVQTPAPIPARRGIGSKNVAGFDYATLGSQVFAQNCQSCHGASGTGVPGVFPPLAGDPIVDGKDADAHVRIVLQGLSGKAIGGTRFAAQMPAFGTQLSDAQIAAVVDHERTSWGNHGPIVTPEEVKRIR